jgi:hypothetical protein
LNNSITVFSAKVKLGAVVISANYFAASFSRDFLKMKGGYGFHGRNQGAGPQPVRKRLVIFNPDKRQGIKWTVSESAL